MVRVFAIFILLLVGTAYCAPKETIEKDSLATSNSEGGENFSKIGLENQEKKESEAVTSTIDKSVQHSLGNSGSAQHSTSNTGNGSASQTNQKLPSDLSEKIGNENTSVATPMEEEKEVCFPVVGCFAMGKPWKTALRPISAPLSPEEIQTTLFYYSRQLLKNHINITLLEKVNMNGAPFDVNKVTAIIVHGFASSGNSSWLKDMKDAYLKQVDANVIIVDWEKGSSLLNYLQVAGNTRVVGKQLATFVKFLMQNYGATPSKFHLIGHSLGAQICSYLAKDIPGIARLTALDPAQPGFEGFDRVVRLDKTDAEFVDVVHTDAKPFLPYLGFGMIAPHGHVDFYMNGGFDQPGCLVPKDEIPPIMSLLDLAKYPVEYISKIITCPHSRAYQFLTEAFNETEKCVFWGHKADVKSVLQSVTNTLTQGIFSKAVALNPMCTKDNCIPLGFGTTKSPLRGSFVVTTKARAPFCISESEIVHGKPMPQPKKESFIQKIAQKKSLG